MVTHKEGVELAYKWVLNNTRCGVAFKELYTNCCNGEYPDVIGFGSFGYSFLVEVKVSRSDFLSDKKKKFRRYQFLGMGTQRFYCCPEGLIKVEELPEKWGLLYITEKNKIKVAHQPYKGNIDEFEGIQKDMVAEHGFMYSVIRRLFLKGLTDRVYDKDYLNKNIQNEHRNSEATSFNEHL